MMEANRGNVRKKEKRKRERKKQNCWVVKNF